jgi:hypothetical protein
MCIGGGGGTPLMDLRPSEGRSARSALRPSEAANPSAAFGGASRRLTFD